MGDLRSNSPSTSQTYLQQLQDLGYAHSQTPADRLIGATRSRPEDFVVTEDLGYTLGGTGPHRWLQIRKRNLNTQDVVQVLANTFDLPQRDIGLSGLKDRNALTTQWFSIASEVAKSLPTADVLEDDFFTIEHHGFEILDVVDHDRKLKRGGHKRNHFNIVIRDVQGNDDAIDALLSSMKIQGVPNYFGEQRFGRNGNNLVSAERFFKGVLKKPNRQLRGFILSAARSFIFNQVLSQRVASGNWNKAIDGDAIQFDESGSFFHQPELDETVKSRVEDNQCHPTGPLWGRGAPAVTGDALLIERQCVEQFPLFIRGLEENGLTHQRRALRLLLKNFDWQRCNDRTLTLSFSLPCGAFATSVLREVIAA